MPRTRSRLTNTKPHLKLIKAAVKESLDKDVAPFIQKYLHALLESNKDAEGRKRPISGYVTKDKYRKKKDGSKVKTKDGVNVMPGEKAPDTIKAYKKKGWETEKYLVRTGDSTRLKHRVSKAGTKLTIEPASDEGFEILSHHLPKNKFRGLMGWMELNTKAEKKIIKRIRNRVRKRLR